MAFHKGDKIEICIKEEGFYGSYYEATVVAYLPNDIYMVQYRNLLEENGNDPLTEKVHKYWVRPSPLEISLPPSEFSDLDMVDALENDGWWVGKITGKKGSDYSVFFITTGDEIVYPLSRLRFHQEWRNGKWVSSKKRVN